MKDMTAADVYDFIKKSDLAIVECELKRKLLVDAWPE